MKKILLSLCFVLLVASEIMSYLMFYVLMYTSIVVGSIVFGLLVMYVIGLLFRWG